MTSFADFVREASGDPSRTPYPWQERFAQACVAGEPPAVVATPTGSGKTTIVDALVWALAMQEGRPAAERTVGVRTVWAIDRRILVDEVHAHAERLAVRLSDALADADDALYEVAARLAKLGGGRPLVATRWRGGLDDCVDIQPPLQPEIITSTVAQVGSRLLFRGYGLGAGSRAMSAGLTACDTTICLDEAHLAQPFLQTVGAVREHRARSETTLGLPGLRTVTITATPDPRGPEPLRLSAEDHDHEKLSPRLLGPKVATLVEPTDTTERERIATLVREVRTHLDEGQAQTVACVVNTVGGARAVHDALRAKIGQTADVVLLVGPQRPADRHKLLDTWRDVLLHGRTPQRPFVCVATQTFEVGLDADVEAMVTESASAAALVQRFGRLNRRGKSDGLVTVVRDPDRWLYRDDEPLAWEWLQSLADDEGRIDVSVAALERAARPAPVRNAVAPNLTDAVVDCLVQTDRQLGDWSDPDIEVFLTGVDAEPDADVRVCWRCDLRMDLQGAAADDYREQLLELMPPQRSELLSVSVRGVRALLASRYPGSVPARTASRLALGDADVEGEPLDTRVPEPGPVDGVPFLVLREGEVLRGAIRSGEENTVPPYWLRPGDLVVLPTRAGGCDEFGLAPLSARATDVAGDLRPMGETPMPMRITRPAFEARCGRRLLEKEWKPVVARCRRAERDLDAASSTKRRAAIVAELVAWIGAHLDELGAGGHDVRTLGEAVALRATADVRDAWIFGEDEDGEDEGPEVVEEDDESVDRTERGALERAFVLLPVRADRAEEHGGAIARPPTLDAHARAVSETTGTYAGDLRLDGAIVRALTLAASVHDHGKADPRMQAYFYGGRAPLGDDVIAKSTFGARDPRADRVARRRSGLPRGWDHEIASVAVLVAAIRDGAVDVTAIDVDLALHLVASHHGRGRAIPRVPRSEGAASARPFVVTAADVTGHAVGDGLDGWEAGEWTARFWRVLRRYGPWGTAYLEALLMSADRTVSNGGR